VQKSYWKSPQLSAENIRLQLLLGLEQGVDTRLPTVAFEPLLKPFVEDRLGALSRDTLRLLAHPDGSTACPINIDRPSTLVIGPEGGFIDYEVALLKANGFTAVSMGPRILRVETAVVALTSRLYPAL
jgi:RsmE family RNA methyltransferase